MILQALKNMYPKASETVLKAVMKDLEKEHEHRGARGLDRETRYITYH